MYAAESWKKSVQTLNKFRLVILNKGCTTQTPKVIHFYFLCSKGQRWGFLTLSAQIYFTDEKWRKTLILPQQVKRDSPVNDPTVKHQCRAVRVPVLEDLCPDSGVSVKQGWEALSCPLTDLEHSILFCLSGLSASGYWFSVVSWHLSWDWEGLNDLPKPTQLINGRAKFWAPVFT